MRHHDNNRKFGRVRSQRRALLSSLANSLILHEKIRTTEAKAKELRPFIERLITKGKEKDTVTGRKMITSRLDGGDLASKKLVEVIAPKYKDRKGGYTRIVKVSSDLVNARKLAIIEFV